MRSRVQAAGSSVFSLAVLNEFEKTGAIPTTMISQGFVGACLKAVCTIRQKSGSLPHPPVVTFIHPECVPSLLKAQFTVTHAMSTFDDRTGLAQIINQAAREYFTVLENNVWMHYGKWQQRAVTTEILAIEPTTLAILLPTKAAHSYAVKRILQRINHASSGPDATRWSNETVRTHGVVFADGVHGDRIVQQFRQYQSLGRDANKTYDNWLGIASEYMIKANIAPFLACGLAMMKRVVVVRQILQQRHVAAGKDGSPRLPKIFQIIPQLSYKTRSVTFGKELYMPNSLSTSLGETPLLPQRYWVRMRYQTKMQCASMSSDVKSPTRKVQLPRSSGRSRILLPFYQSVPRYQRPQSRDGTTSTVRD